jgi:hypothetical protein
MTNQLQLKQKTRVKISEFLIIKNEGDLHSYNLRLKKLKLHLMKIPYHHNFTNELKLILEPPKKKIVPVYQAEAYYKRVKTWHHYFFGDKDATRPAPEIFEKPLCLVYYEPHTIGHFDKIYLLRKTAGYLFPLNMFLLGMEFKLEGIYIENQLFRPKQYEEFLKKNGLTLLPLPLM